MKKAIKIISIILFPLIMVYCIGKSLFGNKISGFFGSIFLVGIGIVVGIAIVEPQAISEFIYKVRIW